MHILPDLFPRVAFIAFIFLISRATAAPNAFLARPLFEDANIRISERDFHLELPVDWRFKLTDAPQTFDRLSTAAENLDYLYELAKDSVVASSRATTPPSTAVTFRVGAFILMFRSTGWDGGGKATIPWHLILYFCNSMQYNLDLGAVWEFEGLLSSRSLGEHAVIHVQLKLMPELGKT